MKFKGHLTEAILLKRYWRFLTQVVLKNRKKRMVYCPNLSRLRQCDVLGSRLWFSRADRLSQGYLDIWEITEINGGWLVDINAARAPLLVREALEKGIITELQGFHFLQSPLSNVNHSVELLLKENGEQCFIHVESVLLGDERNHGYFPDEKNKGLAVLYDLIALREIGHRVILFYCVQHNGINSVRPQDVIDPVYGKVLREAVAKGVEVLAYRAHIDLYEVVLNARIPVLLAEDTISH